MREEEGTALIRYEISNSFGGIFGIHSQGRYIGFFFRGKYHEVDRMPDSPESSDGESDQLTTKDTFGFAAETCKLENVVFVTPHDISDIERQVLSGESMLINIGRDSGQSGGEIPVLNYPNATEAFRYLQGALKEIKRLDMKEARAGEIKAKAGQIFK